MSDQTLNGFNRSRVNKIKKLAQFSDSIDSDLRGEVVALSEAFISVLDGFEMKTNSSEPNAFGAHTNGCHVV